ncbi:hypothetical protein LZ198_06555 [Myxococcus sp. K15C18031901]|uniref:hypothetical protein n=1 Tax=Myxococcus dinghuensis TaxID=2906761 RepID=UPI0020A82FA6|nr:hypothetical protein [Myxococcus dinghuensis]MCP3098538.1 hypothetical protein [Myxococcus dinghuensis]
MRAEDLLTTSPTAEAVAEETRRLPAPSPEAAEALRHTLERSANASPPAPWPALLQEARGKMDSRYAGPVTSHRGGLSGPALVLAKRAFRLLFQPFINEALRKQVEFNESILDALATIHDVQREHARAQASWRQEMDRRLANIEAAALGRVATREASPDTSPAGASDHGSAPTATQPPDGASTRAPPPEPGGPVNRQGRGARAGGRGRGGRR